MSTKPKPRKARRVVLGWQPIETAPRKPGILLLAYAPNPDRIMVCDSYILALASAMAPHTPSHLRFSATHWMPLPDPPKAKR